METRCTVNAVKKTLKANKPTIDFDIVERAYMVIDIIDSARICATQRDIDSFYSLRKCLDVMCCAVNKFDGIIVKTIGDGIEASFRNPNSAVTAAIHFMNASEPIEPGEFDGARVGLAYGKLIRYSVGCHTDYFGREVILAARMAKYGSSAGIAMSSSFAAALAAEARRFSDDIVCDSVKFRGIRLPEQVSFIDARACARVVDSVSAPIPLNRQTVSPSG